MCVWLVAARTPDTVLDLRREQSDLVCPTRVSDSHIVNKDLHQRANFIAVLRQSEQASVVLKCYDRTIGRKRGKERQQLMMQARRTS